ncbi:hypothetical protein SD70_09200 [Gordoniibacillus kamchatkensis]|uniref:Uncharacterized protein n=1 Tax=Gordoniibacillus kamchatkensis TaxID=1590651 RepID=A0ABR5ALF0_9BACL|nr:hypothetical protein [Paenibacillus sp. VKM B-2647]KIL41187.1 hypothetical protein SD70_09200 [Paenibacillus sp. VKM B-2647]
MNRTNAQRIAVATLAFGCALGGMYIGCGRTASAAAAPWQIGGALADAVATAYGAPGKESRSEAGTKRPDEEAPPIVSEAASLLGMDANALTEQLKAGKSIADVAQERGMSAQDLTARLLRLREARIDDAVKTGKLDAARAALMKQRMGEHLDYMVKEKGLLHHGTFRKSHGWKPNYEQLAAVLGVGKDELRSQLKAGKSLAEIAAAKGMSRDELVARLKEQMTPQLERWIDRKHPAAAEK